MFLRRHFLFVLLFFLFTPPLPTSTLFPYTTLFRSFPSYVPMAREILKESRVKIATVIAFPFGVTYTEIKEAEMRASAARGADEMDFVINIAALKSGDEKAIEQEMEYLTSKARTIGVRTKFIIETAYLTDDEKLRVCKAANRVKPDFMKTSTGYG